MAENREEWLPIASAPRDPIPIRLRCSNGTVKVGWRFRDEAVFETESGSFVQDGTSYDGECAVAADGWQPLPETTEGLAHDQSR